MNYATVQVQELTVHTQANIIFTMTHTLKENNVRSREVWEIEGKKNSYTYEDIVREEKIQLFLSWVWGLSLLQLEALHLQLLCADLQLTFLEFKLLLLGFSPLSQGSGDHLHELPTGPSF